MSAKKIATATEKGFSFEASMERLEKLVKSLESGDLTLEESLKNFEEGVKLVRACRDYLGEAKARVEVLLGEDAEGKPLIEPYEEDVDDDEDGEE